MMEVLLALVEYHGFSEGDLISKCHVNVKRGEFSEVIIFFILIPSDSTLIINEMD